MTRARSFVPPVREEESETQRKAHAKRVRETRRSTQGVALEDIKSAEQYVKSQQQQKEKEQQKDQKEAQKAPVSVVSVQIRGKSDAATPVLNVAYNGKPPDAATAWSDEESTAAFVAFDDDFIYGFR